MLTYDVLVRYASAVRCGQCVTPLTANPPAVITLRLSGMLCHPPPLGLPQSFSAHHDRSAAPCLRCTAQDTLQGHGLVWEWPVVA